MPYDKDGNIVDVIMDSSATISRMNVGRLYDAYISASSRIARDMVRTFLNNTIDNKTTDAVVDSSWEIVLDYLSIVGTEQYDYYLNIKDREAKETILKEIIEKELYVYYPVDADKKAPNLTLELESSKFNPLIDNIIIPNRDDNGFKETKEQVLIAPMYIIMLYKIADSWLSTASSKVNHFGLPIGVSKKDRHRLPGKNAPTKVMSETEVRLYGSYVDDLTLLELKDKANSIETHKHTYLSILKAHNPTDIEKVVDRKVQPYGEDRSLTILNSIFHCAGMEIVYSPDLVPNYEDIEFEDE